MLAFIAAVTRASIQEIRLAVGNEQLQGSLLLPADVRGLVILALRSARSERAQTLVRHLRESGLGTLLMPLLTPEEEQLDAETAELRFDIPLLAQRILAQVAALEARVGRRVNLGIVASSTAAAGALVAAAKRPDLVRALVLQGGRPELAVFALSEVQAATLLLVGADDELCIHSNQIASLRLHAPHRLEVIEGAGHRFAEPGKLKQLAALTATWFQKHLHHLPSNPPPPLEIAPGDENAATK
jgi:dienelactone hydrolase